MHPAGGFLYNKTEQKAFALYSVSIIESYHHLIVPAHWSVRISQTDPDITSRKLEDEVDKKLLKASILKLNQREKDIMEMRFGFKTGKEKTQKEVADELRNITKLYIKIRKENYK